MSHFLIFVLLFIFYLFYCYSVTIVPIFPTLPSSTQHIPHPHVNPYPVVHVHGSFCKFFDQSLPFICTISPPSPLATVSLLHVSMSLVLFCSLVYFVHQFPLIDEIMWYLSFTDWLISLSIIVFNSIHAVTKGRTSFFLLCSIPLCRCIIVF